jgi:hypothetical protein
MKRLEMHFYLENHNFWSPLTIKLKFITFSSQKLQSLRGMFGSTRKFE